MFVFGQISAFIHVSSDLTAKSVSWIEFRYELHRNAIEDFPSVLCSAGLYIKELFFIFPVQRHSVSSVMSDLIMHAAVRIYLEVEVSVSPFSVALRWT